MTAAPVAAPPGPAPPSPRRGSRTLRRLGLVAVVIVLLAAIGAGGTAITWRRWSRQALPALDGEIRLAGLTGPVVVRRDALGVPHLAGSSALDVFRAQGYVTAQDRLWQMDLMRRRALGELAEAFGEPALPADQEIRTLGLGEAARASAARLPRDLREMVEAYAAGVNAFIESHRERLPIEFRLLRYEPRPWAVVDTIAVGKLLALDLAQGWEGEVTRALLDRQLSAEEQEMLFPLLFDQDRILVGSDGDSPRPAEGAPIVETSRGSNNWVVSGAHTASGRPLLANDPHLGLGVPSIWTAVHLTAPDLDVAGVTLPGTPGVVLGRNRRIAWGCTNVHDDNADLYVEQFDHARARYRVGESWEPVQVRHEQIRVRTGALSSTWRTVDHLVRLTRHGPMVTIRGREYALRWTSLDADAVELIAFARLQRAGNWQEFTDAVRMYPGPAQNFVYGDVDGHVGWYCAGRIPLRRTGDGSRPCAGATGEGDWVGFIPFEELPHVFDPPSGRIVTANNRLTGTSYPYKVTRGGIGPWRAAAIFEGLEAREGWTADDFVKLQAERLSLPHRDLKHLLLEAAARHPDDAVWREIVSEMKGWDGRLEPTSRAAALAVGTLRATGERVISARLFQLPLRATLARRTAAIHKLLLERPPSWAPARDWDTVLRGAWLDATADLTRRLGADRAQWRWGAVNRIAVGHPLSGAAAPLAHLFNPPAVEAGGFSTTPNVLGLAPSGAIEGPSMRFIADLADPDQTRLVNFMGQSGHPASEHYGDQFDPWVKAETRRLPFTQEAVARATRHTLKLVP